MEQITIKARAKINPYLQVLHKRPDGYHELLSVMQTLGLYDSVLIKKTNKYPFRLICEPDWLPNDERNLCYRAAKYIIEEYDIKHGVFIKLTKRIPVAAGLGGGSSDCAATIKGLNELFELGIPQDRLLEIAGTFGADVPFCVLGGTVLAEGIGEKCTPLPSHPFCYVVLARPPVLVSTELIFKKWSEPNREPQTKNADDFLDALKVGDLTSAAENFYNSLLPVTSEMYPEINILIETFKNNGALGASMTGSGPTVFGYFDSKSAAQNAVDVIKKEHPTIRELFLTNIYSPL